MDHQVATGVVQDFYMQNAQGQVCDKSGCLDFGGTPPDPELDQVSSTRIGHFTSSTVGGTKTINSRGVIVF
jgi:hypothetical protein